MNTTFSNYLEKLRISRNISRNDFVSGILSERQYRRYLKGESTMPNDKVHLLVTKLGLDLADFYMSYLDDKESHLQVIKNLFNLIRTGKLAEANTLISTINYNELSTSYQKQFYTFCELNLNVLTKKTPKSLGYELMLELIDYPRVLENKHINFVELVALESASSFLSNKKDDDRALTFLFRLLTKDNYEFKGLNFMVLPSVYANLSKTFLIKESYEKAFSLVKQGLSICKKYETYNSMANLLYYEAYCCKQLKKNDMIPTILEKLKNLLSIEENVEKSEYYLNAITKNF